MSNNSLYAQNNLHTTKDRAEKSQPKSKKWKRNLFKILFKGLEILLLVLQLLQIAIGFFRK